MRDVVHLVSAHLDLRRVDVHYVAGVEQMDNPDTIQAGPVVDQEKAESFAQGRDYPDWRVALMDGCRLQSGQHH